MKKIISLRRQNYNKHRPTINNDRTIRKIHQLSTEKYRILLLLVSLFGILMGAICYRIGVSNPIIQVFTENFKVLNSGNFKSIFLYLIKIDLLFYILSFLIGTSFLGAGISFVSPMLKCVYIGYFCGYLYNEFQLKGVLFCLLLLYPCFAITTTSLIFLSNENIYMSQYIFKSLNGKLSVDNISIKLYLFRYFLLVVINTVCISITSLLISVLGPKINIL